MSAWDEAVRKGADRLLPHLRMDEYTDSWGALNEAMTAALEHLASPNNTADPIPFTDGDFTLYLHPEDLARALLSLKEADAPDDDVDSMDPVRRSMGRAE